MNPSNSQQTDTVKNFHPNLSSDLSDLKAIPRETAEAIMANCKTKIILRMDIIEELAHSETRFDNGMKD